MVLVLELLILLMVVSKMDFDLKDHLIEEEEEEG